MLFLKVLLSIVSFGFLAGAIGTVAYDIYLAFQLDRILRRNDDAPKSESGGIDWLRRIFWRGFRFSFARSVDVACANQCAAAPDSLGDRRKAACACRCHFYLPARVLSSCLTATRACA